MTHDHWIPRGAQQSMSLMLVQTNIHMMQPCRTMKVFLNRKKRINQIINRVTRCGFPVRRAL